MTFPEQVAVAIIAAAVAFLVSMLFRHLDSERPRWRVTVKNEATPLHSGGQHYVEVTAANVGNGPAYDARILTTLRTETVRHASSVVKPGEELHALVPIRLGRVPEFDELGDPIPVPLAVEYLGGARVHIHWTRPPAFWILRRNSYPLDRAFSRQQAYDIDA